MDLLSEEMSRKLNATVRPMHAFHSRLRPVDMLDQQINPTVLTGRCKSLGTGNTSKSRPRTRQRRDCCDPGRRLWVGRAQ